MKIANLSGGTNYYTFNNEKQTVMFPNNESETDMHQTTYYVTYNGLRSNDVIIKQQLVNIPTYEYSLMVNNNLPTVIHSCTDKDNNEITVDAKYKTTDSDEWILSNNYGLIVDSCDWITNINPTNTKITYDILKNNTPNNRECVFTIEYQNFKSNITIIQNSGAECQKNIWQVCLQNNTKYNLIKSEIKLKYNIQHENSALDTTLSILLYNNKESYTKEINTDKFPIKIIGCYNIEIVDYINVNDVSEIKIYNNADWIEPIDVSYDITTDEENKIIYVNLKEVETIYDLYINETSKTVSCDTDEVKWKIVGRYKLNNQTTWINDNENVIIEYTESWIKQINKYNDEIGFILETNNSKENRTANIIIKYENITSSLTLTQQYCEEQPPSLTCVTINNIDLKYTPSTFNCNGGTAYPNITITYNLFYDNGTSSTTTNKPNNIISSCTWSGDVDTNNGNINVLESDVELTKEYSSICKVTISGDLSVCGDTEKEVSTVVKQNCNPIEPEFEYQLIIPDTELFADCKSGDYKLEAKGQYRQKGTTEWEDDQSIRIDFNGYPWLQTAKTIKDYVVFTLENNDTKESRNAVVYLKYSDIESSVTIYQSACYDPVPPHTTDALDCTQSKLIISATQLEIPSDVNEDMTPTTSYTFSKDGEYKILYVYFHPYYTESGWHKWEQCDIVD